MLKVPDTAVDAVRLIRGINGKTLAGIFGDDLSAAVKVAQAHGTQRWLLVPKGEDAALVMDAAYGGAPALAAGHTVDPDRAP
jgi:hypothetical protein